MWWGILIAAVAIGIGLMIGIPRAKEIKRLQSEGKIVRRAANYAEKGEEFTARIGSFAALKQQLEQAGIPCAMEGNAGSQVNFRGSAFAARLYVKAFDQPSGIGIFRFEFTKWKTGSYGYEEDNRMNQLMTAVEKVFLTLDPNAGVTAYELDFKTKHSFL